MGHPCFTPWGVLKISSGVPLMYVDPCSSTVEIKSSNLVGVPMRWSTSLMSIFGGLSKA